ncbi:MAG TPA: thymidylate kinase [Planctomycetaceae bacterium]|nr:thymidylate kinase [Planctomycetaceae bacterium]HQZ64042.1 thymidylate kinase [Planctomycetaceae bacterium]HRA90446.1 thymidylate kinase [Planctomycetaceae bacterium]
MAALIAIEGIDGAGKGTQAARLVSSLREQGLCVDSLQFPRYAATTFGSAIGDFLNGRFGALNEVHPQLAAVLYAGDRYESRSLLLNMMDTNDVVVLDRFVGSNLAHQSAKLEGDERTALIAWIEKIEFEVFQLPRPTLTILIDMSSQMSRELVARKAARDYTDQEADLQESDLPYLEKVRRCYLALAHSRLDWRTVHGLNDDGSLRTIDDVATDILQLAVSHRS